jgi:hypothetical protein
LISQELHLLLELELSELFLTPKRVVFPFELVHLQLILPMIALLLQLELVQLPLRLVQLLLAERCGATCVLVPQLVELPLRLMEFLGALELLQLFALGEFVDVCLLGRVRPRCAERVGRRPEGGRSQKHSGQQQTYSNGPKQCHRFTSFAL